MCFVVVFVTAGGGGGAQENFYRSGQPYKFISQFPLQFCKLNENPK